MSISTLKELDKLPVFCVWYAEPQKSGEIRKIPCNARTGKRFRQGDFSNPSLFTDRQTAQEYIDTHPSKFDGLGVNLRGTDYIIFDVDHVDQVNGALQDLPQLANTWGEVSHSGAGLHFIAKKPMPAEYRRKADKGKPGIQSSEDLPYIALTGDHIPGTPKTINPIKPEFFDYLDKRGINGVKKTTPKPESRPVQELARETKPDLVPAISDHILSDRDILVKLRNAKNNAKFDILWKGGNLSSNNASEADFHLMRMMAHYTHGEGGQGDEQLYRLFVKSGRLEGREEAHKDKPEYITRTIKNVINGTENTPPMTTFYTRRQKKKTALDKILDEQGETSAESWHSRMFLTKDGNIQSALHNIHLILANDERLKNIVGYNQFSKGLEKIGGTPYASASSDNQWRDTDDIKLALWIADRYSFQPSTGSVAEAVAAIADDNSFHPVKDYLSQRRGRWDGTPRVKNFAAFYLGGETGEYPELVCTILFVSAVARIMRPGCKVDTVTILEGYQGRQKSTAIKALMPNDEWFTDTPVEIGNKDGFIALKGRWMIELAELESFNRAEAERAKAFFSSPVDSYREPYGRREVSVPRECVFIGSVNRDNYLKDSTGARRYLPLKTGINGPVDVEQIETDRDQLWSEALQLFESGVSWWYDSDNEIVKAEQEQRFDADVWEEVIEAYLDGKDRVSTTELLESALGLRIGEISSGLPATRLSSVMQRMERHGWRKGRPKIDGRQVRGYILKSNEVEV